MSTNLLIRAAEPADLPAIERLLQRHELPVAGVAQHLHGFLVGEEAGRLVGVAGVEGDGTALLLRSVAVRPESHGQGHGKSLARAAMALARAIGARELWLLTLTADRFFARLGFEATARDAAPAAIRQSEEFARLCPATAVLMRLDLTRAGP